MTPEERAERIAAREHANLALSYLYTAYKGQPKVRRFINQAIIALQVVIQVCR